MKTFLLSTGLALGLGALAFAPANAAPIATHATIIAPASNTDAACRTVKKVTYYRGVKKVVTSRQCDRGYVRRDYYRPGYRPGYRPYYPHPRPRPGVTIGIH